MAMFGRTTEGDRGPGGTETIIGSSVKVEGKFVGHGNVVVEGRLVGSLKTDGNLRITAGAVVKADIEAKNIEVAGSVNGNVKALERLDLVETAKVAGNIETKTLSVGAGAALNGKCTMDTSGMATVEPSPTEPPARDRVKNGGRKES